MPPTGGDGPERGAGPGASGAPGSGEPFRVAIHRLPGNPDLPLPSRTTSGSVGHDVRSSDEDFWLEPGEIRAAGTGLALELPPGLECQIRPRSGLALRHGITLPNAPGTIDPDYRGELRVILMNQGRRPVRIERGERIAQLVFARFESPRLVEVRALPGSERGAGGFGSTGRS